MNTLLIFFALPIATIILAIVVQKLLRCPVLTAATFFAIYLIVVFSVFDASYLIYVIVYTILAYITAVIAEFFFSRCRRTVRWNCNINGNEVRLSDEAMQGIATRVAQIINEGSNNNCNCSCNSNNVATVNVRNQNGSQTTWCCRRR